MIGQTIKALRKKKKVSQQKMADDLGISQPALACWETGTRRPDIETIPALADYFGVSTDTLLGVPSDEESEEIWALREEVRRDPDRQMLFDLARSASIEDVRRTIAVLDALKKSGQK